MRLRLLLCLLAVFGGLGVMVQAQADDTMQITFPPRVYDLSGSVSILGTVNPPNLLNYFLEVAPYDLSDPEATARWTPVSLPSRAAVTDNLLGNWETGTVPDGVYQLRLHVRLAGGESRFVHVAPLRVANDIERPDGETVVAPPVVLPPTQVAAAPTATVEPTPVPLLENELPLPVGGHVITFNPRTVEYMQSAGLTWMKWQIPFVVGDDSLITVARDRVNFAHENGFRVMLSIKGEKDELRDLGAEYYPLFAEFLGKIALLEPDAIQVWNEQNLDREWPEGRIDPAAYVEMLRQAYTAIKAANPDVKVITGAPAPTGAEGAFGPAKVWNDDRYYAGMASAGAAQYADCLGVHYNEGIIAPQQRGGDPREDYPTRYLPTMIERAAYPFRNTDLPLCFSELGYLSSEGYGPLPGGFAWASNVTVQNQADWLRGAIEVASQASAQVDLIIIWNVDFDVYTDGDPQGGYAIIRPDGSCPACETIATLRQP